MSNGHTLEASKPVVRRVLEVVRNISDVEEAGAARWEMWAGGGWNNSITIDSKRRVFTESMGMTP